MRTAAGSLLAVAGALLALRAALLLAGRGRPRRGARPAFVIAGPYRRARNPLYAGLVLMLAGLAVACGSMWAAGIATAAALGLHVVVVRVEEPRMAARFGPAYAAYVRCVPRWLPWPKPPADAEGR